MERRSSRGRGPELRAASLGLAAAILAASVADARTFEDSRTALGTSLPLFEAVVRDPGVFRASPPGVPVARCGDLALAGWAGRFRIAESRGVLDFEIRPYGADPLRNPLRAELELEVASCSVRSLGDTPRSSTVTLSVDYDPRPGTRYRARDSFFVADAQYLSVRVVALRAADPTTGATLTDAGLLDRLSFRASITEARYPAPDLMESPLALPALLLPMAGEIRLRWKSVTWAEHYELEWTHVNDYDGRGIPATRPASALTFDFRFESTRVSVRPPEPAAAVVEYGLPLVFERGYLLWRVRAVGLEADDFAQPVPGAWSAFPGDSGVGIPTSRPSVVQIDVPQVHEQDPTTGGGTSLNWQHVATFTGRGTRNDVVNYLDGTLRSRQSVTRLRLTDERDARHPAEHLLLATEQIHDHAGRPAVQVLPSPARRGAGHSQALRYLDAFTVNVAGEPYSFRDFDPGSLTGDGCEVAPDPVGDGDGAGRYFSPANSEQEGHQAYVPDAQGYPFVHRRYTPDGTGRVAAEGAPGPEHRIGSGHERRYYYGVPSQDELDRLFGNDVGMARHYKKRLYVDPDGQGSIEYVDPGGRVIATALAGPTPAELLPLDDRTTTSFVFDLLAVPQSLAGDGERRSSKTLLVSEAGEYHFLYRLPPRDALASPVLGETACGRTDVCYDCVYDLELEVLDACGRNLVPDAQRRRRLGSLRELGVCGTSDHEAFEVDFTLALPRGSYQVSKRLRVNEEAIQHFVEEYLRHNTCIPGIRDRLRRDLSGDFDPDRCQGSCASCELDEVGTDVRLPDGSTVTFTVEERHELARACQRTCNVDPVENPCEASYRALLADVSPGGQYARYLDAEGRFAPPALSVLNDAGALPLPDGNWRHPAGSGYREADGSLSEIPIPPGVEDLCVAGSPGTEAGSCRPQHLNRVEDFVRLWKPTWAEALVVYHPEYGYYRWCRDNEATVAFGDSLLAVDSFDDARSAGVLDPFARDPLVTSPARRDQIRRVDTRCGTSFDLTELVHLTVGCNNPNFTDAEARACASARASEPLGTVAETADDEWRVFRDYYRSQRTVVLEHVREESVTRERGHYSNRCIGGADTSGCDGPMRHAEFAEKVKRFPGEQDALDLLPEGSCDDRGRYVDRRLYERCGRCPLQLDLETLLGAAAGAGRLTGNFDLPRYPVIPTRAVLDAFPDPGERQYRWATRVLGDELGIRIYSGSREECTIRLHKSALPDGDDVSWDQVVGFRCLSATDTPGHFPRAPGRNWTANALLVDGTLMPVEGFASCLDLSVCDLQRLCEPHPEIGGELVALSRHLFAGRRFTQTGLLLYDSSRPGGPLGERLRGFGDGPSWYWSFIGWSPSASPRGAFTGRLESGSGGEFNDAFCELAYRSLSPGRPLEPGLEIRGARRIFQDSSPAASCGSPELVLEAVDPRGDTLLIGVRSACHELAGCCAQPACPTVARATPCSATSPPLLIPPRQTAARQIPIPGLDSQAVVQRTNQGLPGCDHCCLSPTPTRDYVDPCEPQLRGRLEREVERGHEKAIEDLRRDVRRAYIARCLDTREILQAAVSETVHHFTLFYYDLVGNLIRTVPPRGVHPLGSTEVRAAQAHREAPTSPAVYPRHRLSTAYRHNSLNQVRLETTPDSGTSRTWYDRLGRPVLSQDARQRAAGRLFGYAVYDHLGRPIESGELEAATVPPDPEALALDESALRLWRESGMRTEYTLTHYDEPISPEIDSYFEGGQEHLRGRVATMQRRSTAADGTPWRHATHFSYDVRGNVTTLIQENPQMPAEHRTKTIEYDYDPISGQVDQVRYQPGEADQFIHRYRYDADDRLVTVETSTDAMHWDRDAAYTYYHHGPLARLELGQERVQGIDYAYTIGGQLKGVNSDSLAPDRDIGRDGVRPVGLPPSEVAADAFGFVLGYYPGDYRPIAALAPGAAFAAGTGSAGFATHGLYGGNITHVTTAFGAFDPPQRLQATGYRYDALNRLRSADVHRGLDEDLNSWAASSRVEEYASTYSYDANGNIVTLTRNGDGGLPIDDLQYRYDADSNRLNQIVDSVGAVALDLPTQGPDNYLYDPNGQMTRDTASDIRAIAWTATGRIKRVEKTDATIDFEYDALGRRVMKRTPDGVSWYVLDAEGRALATYFEQSGDARWDTASIYGPERLGIYRPGLAVGTTPTLSRPLLRGTRSYELTSQVGSVVSIVTDVKSPFAATTAGGPLYVADASDSRDYYPFGMLRTAEPSEPAYPFGFQGMEADGEARGSGNSYTTDMRHYDPRIGRWLATDPKNAVYPWLSPYAGLGNDPVTLLDPDGDQPTTAIGRRAIVRALEWLASRGRSVSTHVGTHSLGLRTIVVTRPWLLQKAVHSTFRHPNVKRLLERALRRPDRVAEQAAQGRTRYVVERLFNRDIGRSGERVLRIVVEESGRIVTAFPTDSFLSAAALAGAAQAVLDERAEHAAEAIGSIIEARYEEAARAEEQPSASLAADVFEWIDDWLLLGPSPTGGVIEEISFSVASYLEQQSLAAIEEVENQLGESLPPEARERIKRDFVNAVYGYGLQTDAAGDEDVREGER